jgi:hypothetical protein
MEAVRVKVGDPRTLMGSGDFESASGTGRGLLEDQGNDLPISRGHSRPDRRATFSRSAKASKHRKPDGVKSGSLRRLRPCMPSSVEVSPPNSTAAPLPLSNPRRWPARCQPITCEASSLAAQRAHRRPVQRHTVTVPSKRRTADLRSGITPRQNVHHGVVGSGSPVTSVT